mmetsp:Transcript_12074/g.14654  ORF Transcript_12074/g.14654 Transcript_12074/m.14654 type:complete len:336 (-) Transcript_12074:958-1965(-)
MEKASYRTGGATSWPRMEPRPKPLPWSDWLFETVLTFTRPIFQVILAIHVMYPLWVKFASYLISNLGLSERFIFAMVTVGTHHMTLAVVNSFFLCCDQFGWLSKFRLPTPEAAQPSYSLKREAVIGIAASGIPMFFGSYVFYGVYQFFGTTSALAPLPSSFVMWKQIAFAKFFASLAFDLTHRTIHSKALYKRIHSKHHRFIATMSIAAEFAHPIEGGPTILGPLLAGMHPLVWCIFLCWEQTNAGITHSGYCFYIPSFHSNKKWTKIVGLGFLADEAAYHHHHHFRNKGNFSSNMFDSFWGTQDDWLHLGGTSGYIEKLHYDNAVRIEKAEKED